MLIIVGIIVLGLLLLINEIGLAILGIAIVGVALYWLYDFFSLMEIFYGVGIVAILVFIYHSVRIIHRFLQSKVGKFLLLVIIFLIGIYLSKDFIIIHYPLSSHETLIDAMGILMGLFIINYSNSLVRHKYLLFILTPIVAILGGGSALVSINWEISWASIVICGVYLKALFDALYTFIKYTLFSSTYKQLLYRKTYIKYKIILFINISSILFLGVVTHIDGFSNLFELNLFFLGCLVCLWLYNAHSPKFIYELLEQFALDNGRFDMISLEVYCKRKLAAKVCLLEDEVMDYIESLIENGVILVVDELYYCISIYDIGLRNALAVNDCLTVEEAYTYINSVIKAEKYQILLPLSNKAIEKRVLVSFPVNIQCGYNDKNQLMLAAEENDRYIVCDYCESFLKKEAAKGKYCSNECEQADIEEERFLKEHNGQQGRELITNKDIILDAQKFVNDNTKEIGKFGYVFSTAVAPIMSKVVDKDHMMGTPQGHGFAAEEANTLIDVICGKNAQVIGYDNIKSGADRLVNNVLVQTKYYKTASQSINAGFENGTYKYLKANGKPMQIEVPFDQYSKALLLMKKHIAAGEVPGIKDPRFASRLVRKGHITYEQAKAVARAGTVESITYDITGSMVNSIGMTGITGSWQLTASLLSGRSLTESIRDASISMVSVYGQQVVKEVIAKQVTKTTVGQFLRKQTGIIVTEASEVLLPKAMANTIGSIAKQNIITGTISLAWMSIDDFDYCRNGYLSKKELVGNLTSSVTQLMGAAVGGEVIGGAIGTLIPFPVVGTLLGATIGGLMGGVLTSFMRTDACKREAEWKKEAERQRIEAEQNEIETFLPFFNEILTRWIEVYMLTGQEVEKLISELKEGNYANVMYKDQYNLRTELLRLARNHHKLSATTIFIRGFMYKIVSRRRRISLEDVDVIDVGIQSWVTTVFAE